MEISHLFFCIVTPLPPLSREGPLLAMCGSNFSFFFPPPVLLFLKWNSNPFPFFPSQTKTVFFAFCFNFFSGALSGSRSSPPILHLCLLLQEDRAIAASFLSPPKTRREARFGALTFFSFTIRIEISLPTPVSCVVKLSPFFSFWHELAATQVKFPPYYTMKEASLFFTWFFFIVCCTFWFERPSLLLIATRRVSGECFSSCSWGLGSSLSFIPSARRRDTFSPLFGRSRVTALVCGDFLFSRSFNVSKPSCLFFFFSLLRSSCGYGVGKVGLLFFPFLVKWKGW